MSGNRFDFLELASATPVQVEQTGVPEGDFVSGPDGEVRRRVDQQGLPLSQVEVDSDVRGYQAFLKYGEELASPSYFNSAAVDKPVIFDLFPVEVIGARGGKAGQFNFPGGVAIDSRGQLYVADSYNHRVQRITPDGGVDIIGRRGAARAQFLSPQSVAVDAFDRYYIVEQGNHRVLRFGANDVIDLVIDQPGHLAGELHRPMGIAVSHTGDFFVADTGNGRVQRFDHEGKFVIAMGSGPGPGALTTPQAVAVDRLDYVYVLDTFGHRILKYDPTGRFVGQFGGGTAGTRVGEVNRARFLEPRAIVIDAEGSIYVADTGETMADGNQSRGRLQVVDGTSGDCLLSLDRLGRNLGCLFRPGGLAIATVPDAADGMHHVRGDLYVADTLNHRILRFAWYQRPG